MKTNPISIAAKAKGPLALFQRSRSLAQRYGFTSDLMDHALEQYSSVLRQFNCPATFPITAMTLKRHRNSIAKYSGQNIEFAVHGYTHMDYSQLSAEKLDTQLKNACKVFIHEGILPKGFRSPYLSRNDHLYTAIKTAGFSYVSNQPILWDVVDKATLTPSVTAQYERGLAFYNPWLSNERPSLPRLNNQLVEIPVSLPDDEILVDRMGGSGTWLENTWLNILSQSYARGEVFTLQLHPERIAIGSTSLAAVLAEASTLVPSVWCARLDEISDWWNTRTNATIDFSKSTDQGYSCVVNASIGTTVLVRAVEIDAPDTPWFDGYREVKAKHFTIHSPLRPLIGLSPSTSLDLVLFLRQQGYLTEISKERALYAFYLDQSNYDGSQELAILNSIEGSRCPLVRFGRWPYSARSALCVTGDIDALTLWDYGLRFFGK